MALKVTLRIYLFTIICYSWYPFAIAQETTPAQFGKISPEDFKVKVSTVDSTADAMIIADVGESAIIANNKGWFSIEYKHFRRARILNKNGYDIADVVIPLYVDGADQEKLVTLKGNTYNLVNGKVETTKFEKDQLFTDKQGKHHVIKKFTLASVKEGSIIEYEYKTTSDFLFNLPSWSFQGSLPRLWSEYTTRIPQFFQYVFLSQGYQPFLVKENRNSMVSYTVRDQTGIQTDQNAVSITANLSINHWVMKDVPPLKEEPYTSTLANHLSSIQFQLSGYADPLVPKKIMNSWPETCKQLLLDEDFGADLDKSNGWMDKYLSSVLSAGQDQLAKAQAIYTHVRDSYSCTQREGFYLTKPGLKNVVEAKGGKSSDINLLLTGLLRHAGLDAWPAILSTTDNGYAHPIYPLMNKYNIVIATAAIGGKTYVMDASNTQLPFGKLSPDCYNGVARKINALGDPITLVSDSLMEHKVVNIRIVPNEKGELAGQMDTWPGDYESIRIRTAIKTKGLSEFKKKVIGDLGGMFTLDELKAKGYSSPDSSVSLTYNYSFNNNQEHMLYILPLQQEATKENPFKSAVRNYPVEMPYGFDEVINVSLIVPEGYAVEEIPKPVQVSLDENRNCMFRFLVQYDGNNIQLSSRIIFKRAYFAPEEYANLREFFNLIVKKQGEQIVLKKI
ncbi:hypothetical protein SAMN05216436_104169 [bacterium A37T11]|nr:hypothetical protein SAMN05216436_104169 [bacterium A37T11]